MIVLKSISQIRDNFERLAKQEGKGTIDEEKFISSFLSDDEISSLAFSLDNLDDKSQEVEDFSELVFQLRDYIPALSNFTKILLVSKNFEAVYLFVKKLFVSQIGVIRYVSQNGPYNFTERYFDRFVEIVKNCKIQPELYLPLIVECFRPSEKDGLKNWKRPALEFLQTFFNEREEWMITYINSGCDLKYDILESICEFNTSKGISLLVKDFLFTKEFDHEKNVSILKNYKKDTMAYLDKNYSSMPDEDRIKTVKILLSFLPDNDIVTRLKDIYETDKNEDIKSLVAVNMGITETLSIKTEKQFLYAVRRKVKEPQERALGIPFDRIDLRLKSGFSCDNAIKTFVVYLLKEEKNLANIKKLLVLNDIFESKGLEDFAEKLYGVYFDKPDVLFAKWAIRASVLFGGKETEEKINELLVNLVKWGREKEAKYLFEVLISSGKESSLETLKVLIEENIQFAIDNKDEFALLFSTRNERNLEDVLDDLTPDNSENGDKKEFEKRLFDAYVAKREYTEKRFEKIFIKNRTIMSLAEKLVWGEYNFGRLYNAFIIENGEKKYVTKTLDLEQKSISIVHSLDLDSRFDDCPYALPEFLFNQFPRSVFDVKTFSRMAVSVNRFSGMFVKADGFSRKLEDFGFHVNKYDDEILFSSLVYVFEELNLIAEVEFEKPVTRDVEFATIGGIWFFRTNDVTYDKNKILTSKSNAVSLGGIPERFFDFILSSVSTASKAK